MTIAQAWTQDEIQFLISEYPARGLKYCAEALHRRQSQLRAKVSRLGLKQDRSGEFFKEWQARAAASKVGKKRPDQAEVMRGLLASGKMKKTPEQIQVMTERLQNFMKTNPHPRGALGMRHTNEAKAKISQKGKVRWQNMSDEEKNEHAKRASVNARSPGNLLNRTKASWKAGWREIGETRKYYRSRWEANYARYLEWLRSNGQISKWEHEPETFWFDGIKRGCLSYLPDFRVTENDGRVAYHEVKGWMDARSKTIIKRMAKYHPNVRLIVIDGSGYKAIAHKVRGFVHGWE